MKGRRGKIVLKQEKSGKTITINVNQESCIKPATIKSINVEVLKDTTTDYHLKFTPVIENYIGGVTKFKWEFEEIEYVVVNDIKYDEKDIIVKFKKQIRDGNKIDYIKLTVWQEGLSGKVDNKYCQFNTPFVKPVKPEISVDIDENVDYIVDTDTECHVKITPIIKNYIEGLTAIEWKFGEDVKDLLITSVESLQNKKDIVFKYKKGFSDFDSDVIITAKNGNLTDEEYIQINFSNIKSKHPEPHPVFFIKESNTNTVTTLNITSEIKNFIEGVSTFKWHLTDELKANLITPMEEINKSRNPVLKFNRLKTSVSGKISLYVYTESEYNMGKVEQTVVIK